MNSVVARLAALSGPGASVVARLGAREVVARISAHLRRLFGMPDYHLYVEHQDRCHPGAPVLSEKEFVRSELERKYAGCGGRCC